MESENSSSFFLGSIEKESNPYRMWVQAEVIIPFLGEDKTSHVRAAVLRCLHFLIRRGMCFSLVHESQTAKFSSLLNQAELSPDMQLEALQIFQKVINKTDYFISLSQVEDAYLSLM